MAKNTRDRRKLSVDEGAQDFFFPLRSRDRRRQWSAERFPAVSFLLAGVGALRHLIVNRKLRDFP